jgi:hypothetical protein
MPCVVRARVTTSSSGTAVLFNDIGDRSSGYRVTSAPWAAGPFPRSITATATGTNAPGPLRAGVD